jgi:hypothetical protein
MANLAAEASDKVLNFVKLSGLDFKIVETPFSLEIQIKKKFTKYNHGSQPKTTLSKLSKNVNPSSNASQPISHSVTATNSQDIMAKPMDSCTLTLPFLTSNYGTMSTTSPFMKHPTSTYPTTTPMPEATTLKVSKPKQPMNTFITRNFQNIEGFNSSTILRPRPPSLTAPPPPRTYPPPARTPNPLKTSSNQRTPSSPRTPSPPRTPPGFPLASVSLGQPIDDEQKGVTEEEFKQLLSEHFESINLDTATIIKDALKPIEAAFDEADRMLDKHLAKQKIS